MRTLFSVDNDRQRYTLWAKLQQDGSLVLEAQDLSPGIERLFGADEYEYAITVRAEHLPRLHERLGCDEHSIFERLHEKFVAPHGISRRNPPALGELGEEASSQADLVR